MLRHATMRKVEELQYVERQPSEGEPIVEVLEIVLDNDVEIQVVNGGWTLANPALQVLAYLGVRPSTMHNAEGEQYVPVVIDRIEGGYEYRLSELVFEQGARILDASEWFVGVGEADDTEAENGGSP